MLKLKMFLFIFLFAITAFCKDGNSLKLVSDSEANLIDVGLKLGGENYGRQINN